MRRKAIGRHKSRKMFKRASGIHPKNKLNPRKFRGGIRL